MNRIHPTAVIGEPPESRVLIHDYYEDRGAKYYQPEIDPTAIVGALCTVDGGMHSPTTIGPRTLLMKRTHIGHDAQIGADCEFGAGVVICGHVIVEDDVHIGGNSWVKPRVRIGRGARIGGGAVVVKDVPPGEIWAGNPAKPLRHGRVHELRSKQSA